MAKHCRCLLLLLFLFKFIRLFLLFLNILLYILLSISKPSLQINQWDNFNINLYVRHTRFPVGEISTAEFIQFAPPLLLPPMSHYFTSFPLSTLTLILYNRANSSHALSEVPQIDPRLDFTSRLSHLYIHFTLSYMASAGEDCRPRMRTENHQRISLKFPSVSQDSLPCRRLVAARTRSRAQRRRMLY